VHTPDAAIVGGGALVILSSPWSATFYFLSRHQRQTTSTANTSAMIVTMTMSSDTRRSVLVCVHPHELESHKATDVRRELLSGGQCFNAAIRNVYEGHRSGGFTFGL
jgi:hypothetical protein